MVISGLALAAVLITVIIAVEAVGSLTRKKVDTSEGVEIIKQAEAAEVTEIGRASCRERVSFAV